MDIIIDEEIENFDSRREARIEIAYNAYFKKFNRFPPIFFELSEEAHKEEWFLIAIYKAIEDNNYEINIEGHYDKNVDY